MNIEMIEQETKPSFDVIYDTWRSVITYLMGFASGGAVVLLYLAGKL